MLKKNVDIIVVALSTPVLVGVYYDNELLETLSSDEHTSEVLPQIFQNILEKYCIQKLAYANGPGSFMSIKVSYLFLKTLSIVNKIPFFATDAFYFNNNQPIKAVGKLYFVKTSSEINTVTLQEAPISSFTLPKYFNNEEFKQDTAPIYGIDAV